MYENVKVEFHRDLQSSLWTGLACFFLCLSSDWQGERGSALGSVQGEVARRSRQVVFNSVTRFICVSVVRPGFDCRQAGTAAQRI